MTEEQWLACDDPAEMLKGLGPNASERKLRLFMVACCRRIWHLIQEPHCREAVEVAEQYLEGGANEGDLESACINANSRWGDTDDGGNEYAQEAATYPVDPDPFAGARSCASCAANAVAFRPDAPPEAGAAERAAQAALLRCIFGFPGRASERLAPALLAWNDGIIPKLAEALDADKVFDRSLILADALEEAGCTDETILTHLRSPGPHVRGCWALDLILGKG